MTDQSVSLPKKPANQRRRRPRAMTPARRETLLAKLAEGWSVSSAVDAAGICRRQYYRERARDEAFATDADEAITAGSDVIEDELFRRAVFGTNEPVGFHLGQHTGLFVARYDTRAAIFLLKARSPDRFKERAEVNMDTSLADRLADARARLAATVPAKTPATEPATDFAKAAPA